MRQNGSFGLLVFFIIAGLGGVLVFVANGIAGNNATIVIVPSTAVESMQLGGLAGMTALTMGLGQERPNGALAQPGSLPEQANRRQELPLR